MGLYVAVHVTSYVLWTYFVLNPCHQSKFLLAVELQVLKSVGNFIWKNKVDVKNDVPDVRNMFQVVVFCPLPTGCYGISNLYQSAN